MEKFIKIYFWQIISILFNFASIFVVTPYLSSNPAIYGVYTLVIAAYLFLAYADFGFLGAGMKFASESYAQKNLQQEIKILGFTGFIFLAFSVLYACGIFYVSFNPEILVKNLTNIEEKVIAGRLLLILSLFCPVFVMQRVIQIIFAIRLEDYVFQKILICANAVKIIFALVFFSHGNYPIVIYFLFSQICTLTAVLIGLYIAKKKLGYDLLLFIRSFRFSRQLFDKTKSLAFVSLFLTFCWIIYYELDPFVISKLLGAKKLAVFAIGFTLMEYFRSIFGIFFSPFIAKFNHFVGLKDFNGLKVFFNKILVLALPLTVFPVVAVSITIKNFIYSWVGPHYTDSIPIAQILVLSFLLNFISTPSSILVMAYERVRLLYITNTILPVIYWLGVFFTFKFIGLQAFADFKSVAFFTIAIIHLIIIATILDLKFWPFLWKLVSPAIFPITFIIIVLLSTRSFLPVEKNKVNLLIYFGYNGLVITIAILIYYFSSALFKESINSVLTPLFARMNKNRTKSIG